MKVRYFLLFLLSVGLFACRNRESDTHFSREKMAAILTDIHYAEVYSTLVNDSLRQIRNKNNDSLAKYYGQVFKHHNVTANDFQQSMSWYEKHPGELEHVYVKVIESITKEEGQTQANPN